MANHLLHHERAAAPWIAASLASIAALLIVVDLASGFALKGWGVVIGPLVLIAAATFWSLARYHTIRLTPSRLVVGRATYASHDFDPEFGVRTADDLTADERAHLESPMPIPNDATIKLAGGGFGRPARTGLVVLRLAGSGKKLVVSTRHETRLGSVLGDWLLRDEHGT